MTISPQPRSSLPRERWTKLAFLLIAISFAGLLRPIPGHAQSQPEETPDNGFVYDVASIKPNKSSGIMQMVRMMYKPDGLSATNVTLQMLITQGYGINDFQLSGAPEWVKSEHYDVEAKMEKSLADQLKGLTPEQSRPKRQHMLQSMLADRCKLKLHRETRELPVYALVVGKNGAKVREAKPGDAYANGFQGFEGHALGAGLWIMNRGGPTTITSQGVALPQLVDMLSQQLGRTVLDRTGLTGKYDFTLEWKPEETAPVFKGSDSGAPPNATPPDSSGPSLFTAIQEQLGLKLESQKGPVEILVIDHIEKPSEN
jgi:uncharacterized protein (TIGR03435 family)